MLPLLEPGVAQLAHARLDFRIGKGDPGPVDLGASTAASPVGLEARKQLIGSRLLGRVSQERSDLGCQGGPPS